MEFACVHGSNFYQQEQRSPSCVQGTNREELEQPLLPLGSMERSSDERGKRDVNCDKQVEKAVTAPNCVLKGSWGEGGSGGIRKKLKSEYAAYLESKYRRNDGSSI